MFDQAAPGSQQGRDPGETSAIPCIELISLKRCFAGGYHHVRAVVYSPLVRTANLLLGRITRHAESFVCE